MGKWGDILTRIVGFGVTGWQVASLFCELTKTAYFSDCLKNCAQTL